MSVGDSLDANFVVGKRYRGESIVQYRGSDDWFLLGVDRVPRTWAECCVYVDEHSLPDECAFCGYRAADNGHPTHHEFMPPTKGNKLRVWANQQFTGESRDLMLAGADALDFKPKRKSTSAQSYVDFAVPPLEGLKDAILTKDRPSNEAMLYMSGWKQGIAGDSPQEAKLSSKDQKAYTLGYEDGVVVRELRWASAINVYPKADT